MILQHDSINIPSPIPNQAGPALSGAGMMYLPMQNANPYHHLLALQPNLNSINTATRLDPEQYYRQSQQLSGNRVDNSAPKNIPLPAVQTSFGTGHLPLIHPSVSASQSSIQNYQNQLSYLKSNDSLEQFQRPTFTHNYDRGLLDIAHGPSTSNPCTYAAIDDKKLTAEIMQLYIANPVYNRIAVMVARVAQKSYGSEKRFLCPPPGVVFDLEEFSKLRKTDSSEKPKIISKVFIKQLPSNCLTLYFQSNVDSTTIKTLFVSDSDRIKDFQVQLKLIVNGEYDLGSFYSNDIKVISKPSKKKQTQKTNDLSIESGSKIALFNRLRSQNVNTRYLFVNRDTGAVQASSKMWGIFYIHLVSLRVIEIMSLCPQAHANNGLICIWTSTLLKNNSSRLTPE